MQLCMYYLVFLESFSSVIACTYTHPPHGFVKLFCVCGNQKYLVFKKAFLSSKSAEVICECSTWILQTGIYLHFIDKEGWNKGAKWVRLKSWSVAVAKMCEVVLGLYGYMDNITEFDGETPLSQKTHSSCFICHHMCTNSFI